MEMGTYFEVVSLENVISEIASPMFLGVKGGGIISVWLLFEILGMSGGRFLKEQLLQLERRDTRESAVRF